MNGRLLITACCCLLLSPAMAQDRDTTATAEHRNGWTNHQPNRGNEGRNATETRKS